LSYNSLVFPVAMTASLVHTHSIATLPIVIVKKYLIHDSAFFRPFEPRSTFMSKLT
jgi:hypothetical protein